MLLGDFADCLADLEEVGIHVDCGVLARIEDEAQSSAEQSHGDSILETQSGEICRGAPAGMTGTIGKAQYTSVFPVFIKRL